VSVRTEEFSKTALRLARQPWRLAAVLLMLALFLTSVYRAATQSISHDEGMMFEAALTGSWSQVLNFEYGNHHVLTDLLSKLGITVFGTSEIALRIPSLLGGLLYFYAVFRISALLFGEGFQFLLSAAFLSLNPFVLDYLSCARGYGLALGLFFYALYHVIRYLGESLDGRNSSGATRLLNKAGVALGLSIGCNPVMIFPGGALLASFLPIVLGESLIRQPEPVAVAAVKEKSRNAKEGRRRRSRREASAKPRPGVWGQMFLHLVLPTVAIGGFISMLPNRLIQPGVENMGPPSLTAILQGLVRYSVTHSPTGYPGLAAWFRSETAIRIISDFVVPASLAGLVIVAVLILVRWIRKRNWDAVPLIDRLLLLLGGMLPAAIVLIVLSRYAFQQAYPELRTAMYWIPLLGLAWLTVLGRLSLGSRVERLFSVPVAAVLVLCMAQFLTQFNTRYFAEWPYCAAGKEMMQIVRADHAANPGARVRVGATWQLEPVINYYRVAWGLDWMDPVNRDSPDNSYDYYLLAFGDKPLVERLHLKTLLSDRLSGTVLARRTNL
jgi:hypothetical protein